MDSEPRTDRLGPADGSPSTPAEAAAWLARDTVESLPAGDLERKLELGRPLRVKLGIDPTAPDIHLGHTVVLRKLREFQDLGHLVVLIIGDYTARVGDPSGRSETRPALAPEQIEQNARTFQDQAFAVLDRDRIEVRRNSEWLDMAMEDLFRLARTTTLGQIVARDDFSLRLAEHTPISVLELLYPLLQGYDSVEVRADVELGGTDQKFNLLLARDIQRAYGVPEQLVLTTPLLPGTDGVRRMSKSLGNYIGVSEPPEEMYGKTLSVPDSTLETWYRLLLGSAPPEELGPRDAKRALARALIARFHGPQAAQAAERAFDRVHVAHEIPEEVPVVDWAASAGSAAASGGSAPASGGSASPGPESVVHLPALIARAFGISTSQARRTLAQGGVRLDGQPVANGSLDVDAATIDGKVLQLGKRRFARVRVS